MKTIGKIIQEKRFKKGWSTSQLAKEIGVTHVTITHWENSQRFPNALYLVSLADVFECTLDELCGRDPTKIQKKENNYERYKKYFT